MNKVILIGNYAPDKQESMLRFANMLNMGFSQAGIEVICWTPIVILGSMFKQTNQGLGKWMGYIDKWIIFPFILWFRVFFLNKKHKCIRIHICDHSNAPYQKCLPINITSITCHDVLAIQGALGYPNTYCEASGMGKKLQKWILNHLQQIHKVATVSEYTLNQLLEITATNQTKKDWRVIHNAFNETFSPIDKIKAKAELSAINQAFNKPYLLHVGSNLERKNRKLLIDMISQLHMEWDGYVCFAGQAIDENLYKYINKKGVGERIISLVNPNHQMLLSLYSACDAFVFPSFSEGFGWPIIEAQACGAPVIASNLEPMPEVSGGAALLADPNDSAAFVECFISLKNEVLRDSIIERGTRNSEKYQLEKMIEKYITLMDLKK